MAQMCITYSPWQQPGGPQGPKGPERTEAPPTGAQGAPGLTTIKQAAELKDLVTLLSPSYVDLLISASEREYINQEFSSAASRLFWIKSILGSIHELEARIQPTPKDISLYTSYSIRTNSLLQQLKLGLDYYGQPLNSVSLLSVDSYQPILDRLLAYATDIEQAYLTYQNAANSQTAAMGALVTAKSKAVANISDIQGNIADLTSQESAQNDAIERLSTHLNDLWVQLINAQAAFQAAVAAQGQGCNFQQILAIGAAVATLFASGGTAASAIGVAISAIEQKPLKYDNGSPVGDDFKGFKYKVQTVVTVGQDVNSFVDAFGKVKSALAPPPGAMNALPGDEAKIVASANDIEDQLKPFLNIAQAVTYRDLIRAFVSTSEARNNKIIEYNNTVIKLQQLNSQIDELQHEADNLQDQLAATSNPFLPEAVNFMEKAWVKSKADVVRMLYQLNTAYRYYSLAPATFSVEDFSVSALKVTEASSIADYTASRQRFNSSPAHITGMTIPLRPYITSESWKKFLQTHQITVAIAPDDPKLRNYANVLATRVGIEFPGRNLPNSLQATIIHEGRALVFDQTGQAHVFSHLPIFIPYEKNGTNLVVDGTVANDDYAGISPYGPWTIRINTIDNGFIQSVTALNLVIDGKARGRS